MKKYILLCFLCSAFSNLFSMDESAIRTRITQMEQRLQEAQSSHNVRQQSRILYRFGAYAYAIE